MMDNKLIQWVKVNNLKIKNMQLQLIEGVYSSNDVHDLITKLVMVKINFHEQKISSTDSEEDIKEREKKIVSLQNQLKDLKIKLSDKNYVSLQSHLNFN